MASKRKQRQRGCKIRLISFSYMSKGQGGKEGQVSKMKIMTLDIRRKLIWSNNAQYLTDRWPVKLKLNFYPICTSKLHCFYFLNKTGIWKIWWGLKKKRFSFFCDLLSLCAKKVMPLPPYQSYKTWIFTLSIYINSTFTATLYYNGLSENKKGKNRHFNNNLFLDFVSFGPKYILVSIQVGEKLFSTTFWLPVTQYDIALLNI